ncbi:MAG TPA: hypothetical protein VK806_06440 [Bacteroidia bacterium]|jgi:hypothetical protein|nr:hypothetical protein [Bacteroidia bacterium]
MKPKVFIVSAIFFLLTCFAKCQTVATKQDKKDTLVKPPCKIVQVYAGCQYYYHCGIKDLFSITASSYPPFSTTYKSTIYRDDIEHMTK